MSSKTEEAELTQRATSQSGRSRFTGRAITVEFTKEALTDLLSLQAKLEPMKRAERA